MNREFPAGNGTFIFRDVVLNGTILPGSWNIKGFVRNATEEDWRRVQFDVELFDETGNTLKNYIDSKVTFIAYSLMKRDKYSFTTNYFKFLPKQNPMQGISRYAITYKDIYEGGEKKDSEKLRFIMVKPWQSRAQVFEDQSIKIVFSISETQIGIVLHNKLNVPIKVDWNNVSYVDIVGLAHAVVHTGISIGVHLSQDRRKSCCWEA